MIYLDITDSTDLVLRDSSDDGRVVAQGALVIDMPPGQWSAPEGVEFIATLRFVGIGTGPGLATEQ